MNITAIWAQGDAVARIIAIVLLIMSVASWSIILAKTWKMWRLRSKTSRLLEGFWDSTSVSSGLAVLVPLPPFHDLAEHGQRAIQHVESHRHNTGHLDAHLSASEMVTRALRNSIAGSVSRLENGLTLLASVGSTAPFVGLFGTVWGIYHALAQISITGQSSLDKVAGPVGEALVMTAAGLFVAIPAVLAYNT
ncbi:MAG: MotA/TolQ/ExbB proton channel family protein, partial [Azoarcus sp.]|nr:MotA/TolQ/ExbB proton channel family protein [Azoarcus sp.]